MEEEGVVAAEGAGGAGTSRWAVKEAYQSLKGVVSEEEEDADVGEGQGSSRAVADKDDVVDRHNESRSSAHAEQCKHVYASSDGHRLLSAGGPKDVKEAVVGAGSKNTCVDGGMGDRVEQERRWGDIIHLESK